MEIVFDEQHGDYTLVAGGTPVATAHPLAAPFWAVNHDGRFVGIAQSEAIAIAQLRKIGEVA